MKCAPARLRCAPPRHYAFTRMEAVYEAGTILLGKYRVESVLGRGGMGVVMRVRHLQLGEDLAIKILLPELAATSAIVSRFLREAQAVVRLRGEHVTRVSDVGTLPDGAPYMLMEYLRGVDLAGTLQQRRSLPPGETVDYVLQACEALAEAHALHIVHRDLKPANLFLTTRPDGTPLIKVLDFGISKVPIVSTALTQTGAVMGTPGYMSPEQMKATREVDARSDIWSLGVVLYECLNGRCPFGASSFAAMVLLAANEPPPAMQPSIPRGLQAVVLRCLKKDREQRYTSIAALASALAPFARDQRAASVIVDRTTLMRNGPKREPETVGRVSSQESPTTLSSSAGVARVPSHRRYVVVGLCAALGSFAMVAAITGRSRTRSEENAARPAPQEIAGRLKQDPPAPDAGSDVASDKRSAPPVATADAAEARETVALPREPPPKNPPIIAAPVPAASLDPPTAQTRSRTPPNVNVDLAKRTPLAKPAPSYGAPATAATPHATPTSPSTSAPCTGVDVDALLEEARKNDAEGHPETALKLTSKAVRCDPGPRTFGFVVMYACEARNEVLAQAFSRRLSKTQRAGAEQKCRQYGVVLHLEAAH
jgi:serine/threonine protein kinase